jgi:hypothetical protein
MDRRPGKHAYPIRKVRPRIDGPLTIGPEPELRKEDYVLERRHGFIFSGDVFFFWSATPFAPPPPRPSIFTDYYIFSLLTGTSIYLHVQWPPTSLLHGIDICVLLQSWLTSPNWQCRLSRTVPYCIVDHWSAFLISSWVQMPPGDNAYELPDHRVCVCCIRVNIG